MIEQLQLIQQDLEKLERSANNRCLGLKGEDRRNAFKRRDFIRQAERAIAKAILTEQLINGSSL